jgi:phage tail-like protein
MTEEFKYQVFKTVEQWSSGLLYRVDMLESGGIALYSTPAFRHWVEAAEGIAVPGALAVDECGQVYIIDNQACRIHMYDPGTNILQQLPCVGLCDAESGEPANLKKIIIHGFTIWILDTENKNIKGFSRENFQIKYIIDNLKEPVDFGVDSEGCLYVAGRDSKEIFKYTGRGELVPKFGQSVLQEPVSLAVGKDNTIYVIDRDAVGFHTFTNQGEYTGLIGEFSSIPGTFQDPAIAIDKEGNIYVSDSSTGMIHQFDPDGSFIGTFSIPGVSKDILGIGIDPRGNLYVSTPRGIGFFSKQQAYSKENGIYYSKTLDSGIKGCQWHRLKLDMDLPPRTAVDVYYYPTDDTALKDAVESCLSDEKKSTQERAGCIDDLIEWKGPGPEKNPQDMLFQEGTGRYLWLKLELSTFEEMVRPSVTGMRVYYPRISYLRYLPAIYQEDPVSKEFLERFLSIFESQFYDLEIDISQIFKYLDPGTTPASFLKWLGSWLNLALEEDWEEDKKRALIKEAVSLYKQKGTPRGLARLIEIYTGSAPIIIEHARATKPMILSKQTRLGIDTMITRTPIRGFRLGDDSILGRTALWHKVMSREDPFLPMVHRFTVILNLSGQEYNYFREGVIRILDEEKPAHTMYQLRSTSELGGSTYVGINTNVSDDRSGPLGEDSTLGTGFIVFDKDEPGGKVERRSRIERDLELI